MADKANRLATARRNMLQSLSEDQLFAVAIWLGLEALDASGGESAMMLSQQARGYAVLKGM